ncbi:hypothetical protein GCM10017667_46710 [Streptomyces filamentosus]|uniref:Uncharacterized protein n=1 Tax=Streptomyces filamentosus TaxID=67294 RepID=A0A919BTQ5_STRFL|nr:hypothetical protein GCM10017667_46710 [Streptomyces filamentosus]
MRRAPGADTPGVRRFAVPRGVRRSREGCPHRLPAASVHRSRRCVCGVPGGVRAPSPGCALVETTDAWPVGGPSARKSVREGRTPPLTWELAREGG